MNNCPRCDSDSLNLQSSRELQVSEINCNDCGFGFQAPVSEDCLEEMWNLIDKEDCAEEDI